MKKKPQWLKTASKHFDDISAKAGNAAADAKSLMIEKAEEIDRDYDLSKTTKGGFSAAKKLLNNIDSEYEISKKAKAGKKVISEAAVNTGIDEKLESVKKALDENIFSPANDYLETSGVNEAVGNTFDSTAQAYGVVRQHVKPYFAPETPEELLLDTKRELIYINACILQISTGDAEVFANKLGAAVLSKIAGAGAAATLIGLVSAFGTTAAGTALNTLYGAAATNATMAWIGGLLGGGMAAGALVTGGVALAVGVSLYKLWGSDARDLESLSAVEMQVVEATGFLIAAITEVLAGAERRLTSKDADTLLKNVLYPLEQNLKEHCDEICKNLDNKNRIAFKQHAVIDFRKTVIAGFEFFIKEERTSQIINPKFIISGVIYALLSRTVIDETRENLIAIEALRRVKNEWAEASLDDLSEDLSQYSAESMKGIANNAKGIYHELLFVDDYNGSHTDTRAEIFGATNYPGADVKIISIETTEVVEEFQLKSGQSKSLVNEHFEKYPDIDVLSTEEISQGAHWDSTGISNDQITAEMNLLLEGLGESDLAGRTGDSAAIGGLIAAGKEAIDVLSGKQDVIGAGVNVVKGATVMATSTAMAAYFFG